MIRTLSRPAAAIAKTLLVTAGVLLIRTLSRPAAAIAKTLLVTAGVLLVAALALLVAGYRIATWPQRHGHKSDRETVLAFLTAAAAVVALVRERSRQLGV